MNGPSAVEIAAKLVEEFEGLALDAYRCPAGRWTIGYGHVLVTGKGMEKITVAEAARLLEEDLHGSQAAVRRLLPVPLTHSQEAALISFTYNLGAGALQRSSLRQKVLRGEHGEVPGEFRKWVWADGKKLKGLVLRRAREAQLYRTL